MLAIQIAKVAISILVVIGTNALQANANDTVVSDSMRTLMTWPENRLSAASSELEVSAKIQTDNASLVSKVEDGLYLWDFTGNSNLIILKKDVNKNYLPYCSATLITGNHIITAAHCFCGIENTGRFHLTHDLCNIEKNWNDNLYSVFSPVFGFSEIIKAPLVHPEYNVDFESWDSDRIVADIAVANISKAFLFRSVEMSTGNSLPERIASVASGPTAFTKDVLGSLMKSGKKYTAGMMTVGVTRAPGSYDDDICIRYVFGGDAQVRQKDTFCRGYDGLGQSEKYPADVVGCKGDSGGGVYSIDRSGKIGWIGVVSNVQIGGTDEPECRTRRSGTTWFVDARLYKTWIESNISDSAEPILGSLDCDEVIIPGDETFVLGDANLSVGITTFGELREEDATELVLRSLPEGLCQTGNTTIFGHCNLNPGQFAFFEARGVGAKVTICRPNHNQGVDEDETRNNR